LIQSSNEKKIPFSFSFGKASADTIQDKGEKKANISSFSFGEATAKPSFSVGSNRKKKKKKKKKATNKTAPVSTSIQFESTEQKDALHLPTPKSASRQTQKSPFSFRSVDTKTSPSTFCFGGTPQNTVDTPSRLGTTPSSTFLFDIAQSPKAMLNSVPLKFGSNSINLVSAESAISLLESYQFSRWCNIAQLFDEVVTMYCAHTVHDWSSLFACNIAYAAAKVGSVGALSFLQEFYGTDL